MYATSEAFGMFILGALLAMGAADAQPGGQPGVKAAVRPGAVVVERVTLKSKVEMVDRDKRLMTLVGARGRSARVKAGPDVKNFDQIKAGDTLTVRYLESVAVSVRKSGEPPAAAETQAVEVAPRGQKPAGMIVNTVEVTGSVESVDLAKRRVTLKDPVGTTRAFRVDPSVKRLTEVKKGDQVIARQTEALALSVTTQ